MIAMNLRYEKQKLKQGYNYVIGCDEVGRGCLAGPVVAAAVIFNHSSGPKWLSQINDSKKLSPEKREYLCEKIKLHALWSIGEVSSEVVDEINIHNASLLAIKKAIEGLMSVPIPEFFRALSEKYPGSSSLLSSGSLLHPSHKASADTVGGRGGTRELFLSVDGKFKVPGLDMDQEAIIEGDGKILSIAAASIVAKVYRDDLMKNFDNQYSGYEFARHKGYATEYHRSMVLKHGLSPIHRVTFCQNLLV